MNLYVNVCSMDLVYTVLLDLVKANRQKSLTAEDSYLIDAATPASRTR